MNETTKTKRPPVIDLKTGKALTPQEAGRALAMSMKREAKARKRLETLSVDEKLALLRGDKSGFEVEKELLERDFTALLRDMERAHTRVINFAKEIITKRGGTIPTTGPNQDENAGIMEALFQSAPEWFTEKPLNWNSFFNIVGQRFVKQLKEEGIDAPAALSIGTFPIHTGQEFDAFSRAACDGKTGQNWGNREQRERRIWEIARATHRVELLQRDDETGEEMTWEALETLTGAQDSDFPLTALYILGVLAPPEALPENRLAGAWIDLNDVMGKIGWLAAKPNETEREELRRRLWQFLVFGSRAIVTGQRIGRYIDPVTRKELPTRIESAPWQITDRIRPEQDGLFPENRPAPVKVYLAVSKEWERLLTHPDLAQYLPLGERLGAIPPNKVAGDWARCIGASLARLWRMNPRETLASTFNPTRRDLLTHYTPKTKTAEEILEGNDPKRAVKYYREALSILSEAKIALIAPAGDAAKEMTAEKMIAQHGGYKWQRSWLDGQSGIFPGEAWKPEIKKRAAALPAPKPKDLKAWQSKPRRSAKRI